ncbi:MAG TPA: ABC transporter permease [Micrococcales bacterium]|uniref:ABC transporter permease n=1 Tax=Miniimonas TaxID=947525 RepID=UPI000D5296EE|nr:MULTISPECIES: ABC transporter permease [Miniimonas]HCX85120.1 ABC transporter permease [Micrococcales bacterium]
MSAWGVRTVAVLEVRQRIRSTRWKVALIAFFVVVGLIAWGVAAAVSGVGDSEWLSRQDAGRVLFGVVLMVVLFLGLLVSPTLSATSVNGDRAAGTLAVLQATTLTPLDLALGKLLAAWGAALAFLATSLPFLVWGAVLGRISPVRVVASVLTLAFVLAVVCAVGLALSASVARPAGSALLTYVVVAGLGVGTLIAFGLSAFFLQRTEVVQVYGVDVGGSGACSWSEREETQTHTEDTAWLLGLNPFVLVADVAAAPAPSLNSSDPLALMGAGVRFAQAGARDEIDECWLDDGGFGTSTPAGSAVWPWSIPVYAAFGVGSLWLTARRLRVPAAALPRGIRIA